MSKDCLSVDELAAADSWPADDPRRHHLDGCARCQGLRISFAAFIDPPDIPEGADPADARARLSTDFRPTAGKAVSGPTAKSRPLPFLRPIWRPALALAAVLVIALGLPRVLDLDPGRQEIVLRGGEETDGSTVLALPTVRDGASDSDGVRLSWHAAEDVDDYRVTVFDSDFQAIISRSAGRDTTLVLSPADVPVGPDGWDELFWNVSALRAGDEIARSAMMTLDLPEE